jgi:serine/threonine protein phosphatase PrpC
VTDPKIKDLIEKSRPQDVARNCVEEAKKNGGDDNVTVMIIRFK